MECDKCGKQAKVFYTQMAEGQIKKVRLCNECASENGVTDPTGFALADMLLGPTQSKTPTKTKVADITAIHSGPKCPSCGFTLDDLKRIRRFGCAECYKAFREEVNMMLKGMHKGVTHQGKVPDGVMEVHQRKTRLTELQQKLEEVVSEENYEAAVSLRDEINKLEDELSRLESDS